MLSRRAFTNIIKSRTFKSWQIQISQGILQCCMSRLVSTQRRGRYRITALWYNSTSGLYLYTLDDNIWQSLCAFEGPQRSSFCNKKLNAHVDTCSKMRFRHRIFSKLIKLFKFSIRNELTHRSKQKVRFSCLKNKDFKI